MFFCLRVGGYTFYVNPETISPAGSKAKSRADDHYGKRGRRFSQRWPLQDRVFRTAPPLGAGPYDVLVWIFDLAGLAVQAV